MTRGIGAAIVALTLMLCGSTASHSADAVPSRAGVQKPSASDAADPGARRRVRQLQRYAYRPIVQPHYYDRPDYYRPYPYALPVPFFLGFGFGPWW